MWAKCILKKYLCKGKSYEKKFAHQVVLKNIPKIQCKGNNNEKNSCGSIICSRERNECNNIFVVLHLVSKILITTKVV